MDEAVCHSGDRLERGITTPLIQAPVQETVKPEGSDEPKERAAVDERIVQPPVLVRFVPAAAQPSHTPRCEYLPLTPTSTY